MTFSFVSRYSKYNVVRGFDLALAGILAIAFVGVISAYDVSMHDTFVLSSYACDDPVNAEMDFCKAIKGKTSIRAAIANNELNVAFEGRDTYWIWLNIIIGIVSFVPALFRSMLGSIPAGLLYFATIMLPLLGGFEDATYFAIKGQPIPFDMPWLNSNPVVGAINGIVNAGNPVTAPVLYLSMIVVVSVLAIGWGLALYKRKI